MRRYNQGWKQESERHSLARRGIKTGKKNLNQLGLVLVGGAGYVGYKMGKHKKHLHASGFSHLKEMEGREIWTDAFGDRFGERVCVLVNYPYLIHDGEKFKPTKKEVKGLWDDLIVQEFGSKEQLRKDLEEEFGKPVTAKGDEPWWKLMASEDYFNKGMDLMHAAPIRHEGKEQRREDLVKAQRLLWRTWIPLKVESSVMSELEDEATKYRMKGFSSSEARTMAEADRVKKFRQLVQRIKRVEIVND